MEGVGGGCEMEEEVRWPFDGNWGEPALVALRGDV